MAGAPRANIYSRQPFSNERVNFDMGNVERELFAGRQWDRAIEVDELLTDVRACNDVQWHAIIIRYVLREAGSHHHRISKEAQILQFERTTGRGKTVYYESLMRVEEYLAMALGG